VRVQAKKDAIPDDWEDDDDDGQTEPEPAASTTWSRSESGWGDVPAQTQEQEQARGEKTKPPIAANSISIAKNRAPPPPPPSYGDSGRGLPSFEPAVRILKRSSNSTGASPAPTTASPQQKSLVEREREYQQARERIFGSPSEGASSSGDSAPKDSGAPSVVVQRQPRGPSSGDAVGFRQQIDQM